MSSVADDLSVLGSEWADAWLQQAPRNAHSIAYENAHVVKGGQGLLYGFSIYSSNAAAQFIQVFDAAKLPADGAIPAVVYTIAATSNLPINWIPPRKFAAGIVICNSTTGPTKTIGAADTWFDVQYL
jgi:hypothetical protein